MLIELDVIRYKGKLFQRNKEYRMKNKNQAFLAQQETKEIFGFYDKF